MFKRQIQSIYRCIFNLVSRTHSHYREKKDPNLQSVGDWFLEGRKHHFELNRAAVDYYLENAPEKVKTNQSIESWLQLTQKEVKELASHDDDLGKIAKATFDDLNLSHINKIMNYALPLQIS